MHRCAQRFAAFVLTGTILVLIPLKLHSDVISGTGVMTTSNWDFSEAVSVPSYTGDIMILEVFEPPLGLIVVAPRLIAFLPDSSYEDMMYAPDDTSLYQAEAPFHPNLTYVVRTLECHYAKFRFFFTDQGIGVGIEYVYQPNGSRSLSNGIAVKSMSWGAIKALYR